MSTSEPQEVLVALGADVDPLLRTARAEIAQLSLQVRSANHEAGELEAALAVEETSAPDLLRTSLDELVASRRAELQQELEQELVRAAAVVSAAKEDATRSQLASVEPGPPSPTDHEVEPPHRLQIVVDPDEDEVEDDDHRPEPAAVSIDAPIAWEIPGDPELLRGLVSAAVTAAVAQGLSAAHQLGARPAGAQPLPWYPEPAGVHAAIPGSAPGRSRPPFRRQLLHLDVLLPLVAVLIVFIVLLAWVG